MKNKALNLKGSNESIWEGLGGGKMEGRNVVIISTITE